MQTFIAETMLALVLIDRALIHRAQNGDVVSATPRIAANAGTDLPHIQALKKAEDRDPAEA